MSTSPKLGKVQTVSLPPMNRHNQHSNQTSGLGLKECDSDIASKLEMMSLDTIKREYQNSPYFKVKVDMLLNSYQGESHPLKHSNSLGE